MQKSLQEFRFRSNMAIVLLCIVIATGFAVNGELRFSLPG
jgi:hypothetical protein